MDDEALRLLREIMYSYLRGNNHSCEQQLSNFFSKGDNASFIHDIEIEDTGNFFWDIADLFNVKYPDEVEASPCYYKYKPIKFLPFYTTSEMRLYYNAGDITLLDLKNAIAQGHWSFKYCNPDLIKK